jgi:hypothetical protein
MRQLKVGDQVRCVTGTKTLVKHRKYTVVNAFSDLWRGVSILDVRDDARKVYEGWLSTRFELCSGEYDNEEAL